MKKIIVFGLIFVAVLIAGFLLKTDKVAIKAPELELASAPVAVTPTPPLFSIELIPGNEIIQGETLRVILKNQGNASSSFIFQNKKYDFFEYDREWNALIPFSASAATGTLVLSISSSTENIIVKAGDFNVETIIMPKIITSPALVAQYQQERKKVLETYASSKPELHFSGPFDLPMDKIEISTEFGETYFDPSDNSRSFHNGVDLRADIGLPVKAINDGIVKTADEYLLEGKFVTLDHGFDIFSNYLHLSEIYVKSGEKVSKGQIIGLSGDTGKSIGPHLHFMVKIKDVPIDPLAFIEIWK
jgi:murein DD-endopeptidase MepM/ murein hydrolase activator NlpD